MHKQFLNPASVYPPPSQYTQAIAVTGGTLLFVSGLVGARLDGSVPPTMPEQAEVALENLRLVLEAAGAGMTDVVRATVYHVEPFGEHREALAAIRSRYFLSDFPTSTHVQVAGLAHPAYLYEIEATAVIPDRN